MAGEADYYLAVGDHGDRLEFTLVNPDGTRCDITGATVVGKLKLPGAGGDITLTPTIPTQPTSGQGYYRTQANDITVPGLYNGKWVATFGDGTVRSFPNKDYFSLLATGDI